jgi:hypothetical protein
LILLSGPPDVPFLVAVDVTGTNSVTVRFQEPEQQDSAICTKFKGHLPTSVLYYYYYYYYLVRRINKCKKRNSSSLVYTMMLLYSCQYSIQTYNIYIYIWSAIATNNFFIPQFLHCMFWPLWAIFRRKRSCDCGSYIYTVDSRVSGLMWRKGRPDNKKAG